MKRLFVLVTALFLLTMYNSGMCTDWGTDLNAFKIGNGENQIATFKFLGTETTKSVRELKEQLKGSGYGRYFVNDQPEAGYTVGVHEALRKYATSYEKKLKAAEESMNKNKGS